MIREFHIDLSNIDTYIPRISYRKSITPDEEDSFMTAQNSARQTSSLGRAVEVLAIIGMVAMALGIVATVFGNTGFDVLTATSFGDNTVMSAPVDLDPPVDFGDGLAWTDGPDGGTVDAATGKPPVELGGPVTAQLSFWGPTTAQRLVWVLWQISGPALGIAALWLIYRMARSTRLGDPFSTANEQRLWTLAAVVAIGGSASAWLGEAARAWLVARSAAAGVVTFSFTLSFAPIIAGIVVAMLASIWHVGVGLREDVEGMV
jgi:hypothetical protein